MIRRLTTVFFPLFVIFAVFVVIASAAKQSNVPRFSIRENNRVDSQDLQIEDALKSDSTSKPSSSSVDDSQLFPISRETVAKIDRFFESHWQAASIEPASQADDLTVLRRLTIELHGTVPSLEEIRQFELDRNEDRMVRWTTRILNDRRFADYMARRLSRVFVGADDGQFILFRRDRFWSWLGDQLHQNHPYDEIVRRMIARKGLWTGVPEVNFITAAAVGNDIDENRLAGRTVRAFLGQRMDCAQCHNHPFAEWKQTQFEGLAAQFGKIKLSPVGVEDDQKKNYSVEDQITLLQRDVSASFPFHPEWAADSGTQRQRLAAWVTNEQNHRFDRAIVNRVWGLMFGKPWKTPVDDLPNPLEDENHQPIRDPSDLLDILGNDFRANGCDLKRLIATIAATRVYRLASNHPDLDVSSADKGKVESANESIVEQTWAAFPITRLRPEQIIGSMLQASSVKTIDQNSHWVQRAVRFFSEIDFVREYGDLGDDELGEHVGTIQQALLRLNGEFTRNRSEADPFTAPGRIAGMAQSDEDCVELCFLCCLTRSPTAMEKEHFVKSFASNPDNERSQAVEDLYWTLFNSVEFCWGH